VKAASSTAVIAALLAAACGSSGADGAPGAAGANGADGPAATAPQASTINQITPRIGLLGRELDIRITFDGPAVPTGASLDLGDGVTVDKLTQDGNALVAHVTVPEAAKVGPRDVTVKAGGIDSIVAKKGFVVAAALDLIVSSGAAEQGGLVKLDLSNHDKTWFDDQNFVLLPVSSQSDGTLVQIASSGFTGTDGSVILLGDPLAKTGPLGFMGLNDPSDPSTPTFVSAPDAVTVAARTPEPLTIGTPSAKTLSKPLETA